MSGGIGREFFTIVTSHPRDFSVVLKMLLEWPYCFKCFRFKCTVYRKKIDPFEAVNRKDKF